MLRDLCSRGRLWVKVMLFLKFALWGGLTIASPMLTITPSQPLTNLHVGDRVTFTFAISGLYASDYVPNPAEASLGIAEIFYSFTGPSDSYNNSGVCEELTHATASINALVTCAVADSYVSWVIGTTPRLDWNVDLFRAEVVLDEVGLWSVGPRSGNDSYEYFAWLDLSPAVGFGTVYTQPCGAEPCPVISFRALPGEAPEPPAIALVLVGLAVGGWVRRRRSSVG